MQSKTRKDEPLKKLGNLFLQGLIAILPVAATLAILYWFGTYTEAFLGGIIQLILPAGLYWPGMGVLAGIAVVFVVGLLVNAYLFRRLGEIAESILRRIPIVKTIYNGLRDIAHFLTPSDERREAGAPVLVRITEDMRVIGFVTGTQMPFETGSKEEWVTVYMPMSYQIGGYTVHMPRSRIEPLDIPVEQAMRMVLTAGMSEHKHTHSGRNAHTRK
jgi:uncharacterized membrane protein